MKSSETFLIVSSLGLIGVAAMAPSVPAMLRRAMARRPAASLPTRTLVALAVAQTVLLVLLCAFVGAYARLALGPLNRLTLLSGSAVTAVGLGTIVGALGGACVFASSKRLVAYVRATPLTTRLLYGGLTEEVIIRWGLMSIVLWSFALAVRPADVSRSDMVALGSIVLTNAVFAVGHLPLLLPEMRDRAWSAAALIFAISLPWGWLALTFGLGSAMAAHAAFHATVEVLTRRQQRTAGQADGDSAR